MVELTQVNFAIEVMKMILSVITILFLSVFFLQWKVGKQNLSLIAFYTKSKIVKHNTLMALGIIALSAAFIVHFLTINSIVVGEVAGIVTTSLEVIALMCMGFSYYKLVRVAEV